MKRQPRVRPKGARLPRILHPLFWDYDVARLSWSADRDLVISRILARGNWDALRWLLAQVPKRELREWLEHRDGAGLSSRQLRFWEAILGLPRPKVNRWLADPARRIWEGR